MADYPIIADISNYIVKMLRSKMCPEPIPSPNNIEVSSPSAQDVDYILGLYLYDIRMAETIAMPPTMPQGRHRISNAPKPYNLYYMMFMNGSSQMGLKDLDVQKILGRAAQIVNDNNFIYPNELQRWLENPEPPIQLAHNKITLDEKVRVWQAIQKPYQVSLFYRAGPVYLSSEVIIDTPRVTDASFGIYVAGQED